MLTSYTQEDQCPIIVGDAYDLSETAFLCRDWEGCEGLPGQADNGVVLLSMSAYGKLPNHRVNGTSSLRCWMFLPVSWRFEHG